MAVSAQDPVRNIEFRRVRSERLSRLTDLDDALAGYISIVKRKCIRLALADIGFCRVETRRADCLQKPSNQS